MKKDDRSDPRPSVLFIDDQETHLATLRRVFRHDYQMGFASSVAEGIEIIGEQRFDVAFVDYAMLGMNGVDFLRAADQIQPLMGRVMLTAHGDLLEVSLANATGLAAATVTKPWTREVIVYWVRHFRAQQIARRSLQRMSALSRPRVGLERRPPFQLLALTRT